jgi:tripartite-type tricarboxylate transporter receptor subunit TctC
MRILAGIAAAVGLSAFMAQPVSAETPAEFYAGKRLTLIVASGVGGGYDVYARSFARFYGRHVPGNPTIVVQNMDGASGLEATNYIANKAPRDGSVILATYNSLLIQPLLDNNQVQVLFDIPTMSWIGSIAKAIANCFTWQTSAIKTLDQAKGHEVLLGATGATGNSAIFPKVLNNLLGTKFKVISGYQTNAMYLAVERGEVEGICGLGTSTIAAAKPDWVSSNKLNILIQFGLTKDPTLGDAPLAIDLMKDANDKRIFELLAYPQEMGRPYAAPPGVPADRLAALRAAFDATMADPEFLAESKRINQDVQPMTGAAMEAMLKQAYGTPKEIIARYATLTNANGK